MPVDPQWASDHLLPSNAWVGQSIDEASASNHFLHGTIRLERYYSLNIDTIVAKLELTRPLAGCIFYGIPTGGGTSQMLGGGLVKELYELKGEGHCIRGIARELGISRNTTRKYVRSPEVPKASQRPRRESKLDPYKEYIDGRL